MKEFITGYHDDERKKLEEELDYIEFQHDGNTVRFFEPSAGQLAIMANARPRKGSEEKVVGQFISLFFSLMDDDTQDYFNDILMDRVHPFDIDSEGGVMDIFEWLMEEWSGKRSKQPSDYQKSQRAPGRASTGSTRAKGSTSSTTRSRASSTSSKSGGSRAQQTAKSR